MSIQCLSFRRCSCLVFFFSVLISCPAWSNAADAKLVTVTSAFESILKMTEGSLKLSDYQKKLQEVEAVVQKTGALETEQQDHVDKILGYLRTARDLMQWASKHREKDGNYAYSEDDKDFSTWFSRYPFLRGAIMEKAPAGGSGVYDPDTALTFLWDRAEKAVDELKGEESEDE
jgi:hypothetical protein